MGQTKRQMTMAGVAEAAVLQPLSWEVLGEVADPAAGADYLLRSAVVVAEAGLLYSQQARRQVAVVAEESTARTMLMMKMMAAWVEGAGAPVLVLAPPLQQAVVVPLAL